MVVGRTVRSRRTRAIQNCSAATSAGYATFHALRLIPWPEDTVTLSTEGQGMYNDHPFPDGGSNYDTQISVLCCGMCIATGVVFGHIKQSQWSKDDDADPSVRYSVSMDCFASRQLMSEVQLSRSGCDDMLVVVHGFTRCTRKYHVPRLTTPFWGGCMIGGREMVPAFPGGGALVGSYHIQVLCGTKDKE